MELQSSRFKVQEILTMKSIPNEVILVHMSKSYLHKIIIIIIITIIIPGFSHQNSDPTKQQIIQDYTTSSVISDCQNKCPKQINNSLFY